MVRSDWALKDQLRLFRMKHLKGSIFEIRFISLMIINSKWKYGHKIILINSELLVNDNAS